MFYFFLSCILNLSTKISLYDAQAAFRVALCDSFNTPAAVDVLRDLVSKANVYINARGKALHVSSVQNVAQWVGDMLRMFGLGEGETKQIGWGQLDETGGNANVRLIILLSPANVLNESLTPKLCSEKKS